MPYLTTVSPAGGASIANLSFVSVVPPRFAASHAAVRRHLRNGIDGSVISEPLFVGYRTTSLSPTSTPDRASFYTYERFLATLLFLAIILACGLMPMQPDTLWQLRAGRDMWQSQHVLLTDVYSHTAYGSFWPNHEWLAEVIYYAMYRFGGLPMVTLFATALIAGGWAITWRLAKGPVRAVFAWTALALVPASLWWEPRPHAFSLLFVMTTVFLLVRRRYLWLPLVFVVWANCHGGVLLGFVILAAGLGVRTLMAPRVWWQAALIGLGCVLAATATPLGLSFWTEIPKSLMRIHSYPIDEWRRPNVMDVHELLFWVIAIAFCGTLFRKRRTLSGAAAGDLTLYACALAVLPTAILAVRNVGPFLMIAVPAMTSLVLVRRERAARRETQRPLLNLAVMSSAAIAVTMTIVWAYRNEIPHLHWAPVPASALVALGQCPDNLYNRYDEGGYLVWFAPDRKVFLDGRQDPYPPDLMRDHIRMETVGGDYKAAFSRYGIHCAYLPAVSPTVAQLSTSGWKTLYHDSQWVVLRD